MREKRTG